jgi:hypothetical protein
LSRVVLAFASFLVAVQLSACSSTHSSRPPVAALPADQTGWLCGALSYDGTNPEYVPRVVRAVSDATRVRVSYAYEVSYGVEGETGWDLFNPFLLVGVPKSKDNVGVSGRVVVSVDGTDFSRSYDEAVVLDKHKFIFSEGDTMTEMRRAALIQLRDLLDQRLLADRSALSGVGVSCRSDGS